MTTASRLLSVVLMVALTGLGVLAPPASGAETQMSSADPSATAPVQPDLYQDALKAPGSSADDHPGAYEAGAAVASVFSVPGLAVLCVAGSVLSLATLAVTFGSGYGAAKSVFEEACIGAWIVTPDDLRAANRRSSMGGAY